MAAQRLRAPRGLKNSSKRLGGCAAGRGFEKPCDQHMGFCGKHFTFLLIVV